MLLSVPNIFMPSVDKVPARKEPSSKSEKKGSLPEVISIVVDDLPELEVVVVGQCDRATTLQASMWPCSEAFEKGYGVGCGGGRKVVTKG